MSHTEQSSVTTNSNRLHSSSGLYNNYIVKHYITQRSEIRTSNDGHTRQHFISHYTRSEKRLVDFFLPETDYVTFGYLLLQICLSVICLPVTFMRPTQRV